ncbi:hypothetical protein GWK47_004313 [Chionoecetes opilio]|uniref:Uncharacterized protein n=1 Tax=Chionoecetes opilio TaxID=41210 RepID=A0A8J4YMG9_CHIOP|nr:hypothetical protein GWK47_004313 [Chionoecetes opilio]
MRTYARSIRLSYPQVSLSKPHTVALVALMTHGEANLKANSLKEQPVTPPACVVPHVGLSSTRAMPLKTGKNRHLTFDEDEDFENVPALEPLDGASDGEEESAEASDSDGAPEEATLSAGKEEAQKREEGVKDVVDRHRQQVKEKRKLQHRKNMLQQEEKRKRMDELRLPQSLLDAVATEQKSKPPQRQPRSPTKKKKKIKTFDVAEDDDGSVKNIDEEGNITLDTGVHVRTLRQETKKHTDISRRAADFRANALYGRTIRRMPSVQLRQMKVKQRMSGKAVFATSKT